VQRASTMAIQALRRTIGSTTLVNQNRPLCERIGGGPIWVLKGGRTRTRAAAWASAAISGPERSGGVRLPTICGEVELATSVGVR